MKPINLVFECDYNDADILLVPDSIADNIDIIVQIFNKWLFISENRERFLIPYNGKMELGIDTQAFLWWLNNIEITNETKAIILKQHTTFCPEYPTAYF